MDITPATRSKQAGAPDNSDEQQAARARAWWGSVAKFAAAELETAGLEGWERDRAVRAVVAARRAAMLPPVEQRAEVSA